MDADLLGLVQQEVVDLRTDVANYSCGQETEREQLCTKLEGIEKQLQNEVQELKERVDKVEHRVQEIEEQIHILCSSSSAPLLEANAAGGKGDSKEVTEKMQSFDVEGEKINESFSKPFIGVPNRNVYFTGREPELSQIQHLFQGMNSSSSAKHCVLAISGLGGCGKTSTAIEYAWRSCQYYTGGIFWLSGENDELLSKSVDALVEQLGSAIGKQEELTSGAQGSGKEKDCNGLGHKLNRLLSWLQKRTLPWLVVVDDADHDELSPPMFELLKGSWMRDSVGHVLITSRCKPEELDELLQLNTNNIVSLHPLTTVESARFLMKRAGISLSEEEKQDLFKLANELGGLPLALEQAAVYIKVLQCTVKEYLEEYGEQRLKLLKERKAKPTSQYYSPERLAIHTTWQVNIEHMSKAGEGSGVGAAAILMMKIAAFLSPDAIPIQVVNAGKPEIDDPNFCRFVRRTFGQKQVVELLTKFSLFEKNRDLNCLRVHRLVQEVIRERCAEDGTRDFVLSCAVRILHKAFCDIFTGSDLLSWLDSFDKWQEKKTQIKPTRLPDPPTGALWITLAMNSNCLRSYLLKYVNPANARLLWFTKENARIMRETALYFCHFRNFTESRKCHWGMLRVLAGLSKAPSLDELKKLTCGILNDRPRTDDLVTNFGFWTTSRKPLIKLSDGDKPQLANKQNHVNAISAFEQKAKDFFGNGDYLRCQQLIDNFFSATVGFVFENSVTITCRANIDPLHAKLYSYRSAALLKLEHFELALHDVEKWLKCCPIHPNAHFRKVYILCKLAQDNSQLWKARARAAMAVFLYHFGENSAAGTLRDSFSQLLADITFVVVANTEAWLLLDERNRVKENIPETVYIFTGDSYEIERLARTKGGVSFVGLPGSNVEIQVKHGILLSSERSPDSIMEGVYVFENLHFKLGHCGILCLGCNLTATNCYFEQTNICDETMVDELISVVLNEATTLFGLEQSDKCVVSTQLRNSKGLLMCLEMEHFLVTESIFLGINKASSHHACSGIVSLNLKSTNGGTVLSGNVFANFSGCAIHCSHNAAIFYLLGNRLFCCTKGIHAEFTGDHTRCLIVHNELQNCNYLNVFLSGCGFLQLLGNSIRGGNGHGVVIANCCGEVSNNDISFNSCWGLVVTSGSTLQVKENGFIGNECGGIRMFLNGSGLVTLENNKFQNSGPSVVPDPQLGPPTLEQKVISGCELNTEEVKRFLHYGKQFVMNQSNSDRLPSTFNPPKIIKEPTISHASEARKLEAPQLCCSCYSSVDLESVFPCPNCYLAFYCGEQCRQSHLDDHKSLCSNLASSCTIKLELPKGYQLELPKGYQRNPFVVRVRLNKMPILNDDNTVTVNIRLDCTISLSQSTEPQLKQLLSFADTFGILTPWAMLATKEAFVWARTEEGGATCRLFLYVPAPAARFYGF